jgi:transposase-like protein
LTILLNGEDKMSLSTLLIAYEINGSKAKELIVKSEGFVGRLKKFQNRKLVNHVSSAWQSLEAIFSQNGHEFQNKLLYTAKDTNSLSLGATSSDLINNSYIMSLLSENNVSDQRYFSFQDESEFEKQQFSLILDQAGTTLSEQEIGVFGWFMCPEDQVDRLLKQVAVSFSGSHGGELHFFEFTNSGKIYPNFSDVSSQRFEGKLAGNYQMVLNASEYNKGIEALNQITLAVFRTKVLGAKSEPEQKKQQPEKDSPKVNKSKKTYSDEFKDEVAKAALEDGKTLAAVGEKYGVHPTLVRTWKIKLEEQQPEKMEVKKADKEILDNKEENQELGVLISSLNDFRLEGHIDHEKDLSVRVIFEENEKFSSELLVLQGKATLSSNKKTLDADVFESFNLDGYNGPNAGYLKLEENCEPEFSINLKAEVYRLEKYQVIEIDTSDKNALKGIELSELNNFKIDKFKITFDDDNDIEVKGEIVLKDSNVYAISLETEAPDEDPYHNPEMAEDGKAELDQGVWGTKKGATIYLVAAQFEKISGKVSLEGSGVAEISEPIEEDEDFFDHDDSDEKLYVNIASISVEEIVMEIDENGYATSKESIFAKISGFMAGIIENVDSEARFFLHASDKMVHEIHADDELNEFFDSKKSGKFENIVHENDYLKLAFTARGANHWDDGFLSTSAAGVGNVNIWGFYPSIGEHAVQGYWDGNFDTGIAADPEDDANYTGDERMSFYGITDSDFEPSKYGLELSVMPEIEDVLTEHGAVGLFEFQIKRGLVDEQNIDDEELQELVDDLKNLCDDGDNEAACELILPNLSFELDPSQLDDDPDRFFSDTDYIELECTDSNTSVKVGNEDGLSVTIVVKFEIPLNEGISTKELSEYLPESGAWSAASVSPGWGYTDSDGDNVWFIGLKSEVADISDISSQETNSDEFRIEVASACAESGVDYREFAEKYGLDANELNSWAVNFLGTGFKVKE